ncbi:MAG: aminopeptidase P N-terminal domain-containing protein [Bdellovibrionota bacterium]
MSRNKPNPEESVYQLRRTKIIRQIRGEIALIASAPETTRSRDQSYPYQQNSDFYYLTGLSEPESALVLIGSSRGPRSVLFLRDRDPVDEAWHGERLGIKRAKRRFQVDEVRDIRQLAVSLNEFMLNARAFHYSPGTNPKLDAMVQERFASQTGPRLQYPNTLKDVRLLTSEMRFVKDRTESHCLRHASDITARAMVQFLPQLKHVVSERHGAAVLESYFYKLGAHGLAFPTIMASGKNATTLHHTPQAQPLWKRELVLIDAGASFRGYSGDITRTVPASGKFTPAQAEVYDVVLSALEAGTAKARPDCTLDDIHEATVKQLTRGLIDIGVLRGNVADRVQDASYRKFYMHRTSHWLGLDTHDISPVTYTGSSGTALTVPASMRPLVPGNALTVEPGLYFGAQDSTVPEKYRGIGIRIEDDVLITPGGCEVMSGTVPTARDEIEALLG